MRIAFLTNELVTHNPQNMWKGILHAANEHDVNTVCLVGGQLHDPHKRLAQANTIYDLVTERLVDGVIIRGHLCTEVDYEQEMMFYRRFHPLPRVVIGRQVEGIPHLIMDGYNGMRDAVTHLIEAHGCHRIAFCRGPELYDAQERYRAYLDVLRDYDIPFCPDLVTPSPETWDSHQTISANIDTLLSQQLGNFDAVVTASDNLAQMFMSQLSARGIRVPEDVAVVGFDNTGRVTSPRLTSVDAGFYEQGKRGTEMLFALLDGQPLPERFLMPTRLHIRQSCGCFDLEVVRAAAHKTPILEPAYAAVSSPRTQLENLVHEAHEDWYTDLLQALIDQLEGAKPDHFLRVLEGMLRSAVNGDQLDAWHNRISSLREQSLAYLGGTQDAITVEDLFQQARVLVSQAMLWEQAKRRKEAQQRSNLLYEISQALVATFDTKELMEVLARELPRLDIPGAYISLYENPAHSIDRLQLQMAYNADGHLDDGPIQQSFPAWQLVPEERLLAAGPYHLVAEPLYFHDESIGLAVFEVGPRDGGVYDTLRGQISSALKGAQLFIQNTQLYQDAKDAQKTAEEANRLKSRFLASVSHELRTPLNMLIGLSEMLLEEHSERHPPLPAQYRHDLERINTSAHHLDDLLRDVLDLAHSQVGRLKLVREPLDLRTVLETVSALVEPIVQQKGLDWRVDIPDTLIPVWGDAARIKQVLLNLIHNATKFTAAGEIALMVTLSNSEVTIIIRDTGLEIPIEEQELIFDEFHTSQRAAARGYGGMGLGLAICRKLVEMHNGRIGVTSPGGEGSGSSFYFTLPIMSHYPDRKLLNEAVRKQTVLLLSAKDHDQQQLEEYLMREGFQIESMKVNPQVPGILPIRPEIAPALVILDIDMTSTQSQDLIRLVKGHPNMESVPILFYSLLQEQSSGSMFMLDHIAKPMDTGTLSRALARYGLEEQQQTTILIVDDDGDTLDMNVRTIQAQMPGCRVLEATGGRRALELMRQYQPDLVLLDLMMPDMDGFDVLMAMQMDESIRHIPTIVLTAMSLTEEDMARMSQGAAAVLSKGLFSAEETLAHIEKILTRDRQLGSEAQRTVRKVMAYIHQHYHEALSRSDLASYAGVSERHLDRCFQQNMGITPVNYLNRYRVRQAKALLSQTDDTLTEIALNVGFSSSSQFSRVFKREMGTSPSTYRKGG